MEKQNYDFCKICFTFWNDNIDSSSNKAYKELHIENTFRSASDVGRPRPPKWLDSLLPKEAVSSLAQF